jgi:hypothetical protein
VGDATVSASAIASVCVSLHRLHALQTVERHVTLDVRPRQQHLQHLAVGYRVCHMENTIVVSNVNVAVTGGNFPSFPIHVEVNSSEMTLTVGKITNRLHVLFMRGYFSCASHI